MIQWAAFLFLGCIAWGTTFMWIKVALEELGPFTIVAYRCAFGLITVIVSVLLIRQQIEWKGIRFWLPILLGLFGTSIPITLITWAETRIDSGLAGILNATMPIWTMAIAHFVLRDDRLSFPKAVGMLLGFVGIFLLINPEVGVERDFYGQIGVVLAAVGYAATTVAVRRYLKGVHPLQTSLPAMISATVFMLTIALLFESPLQFPVEPMTWLACGWMGIIGMGLAVQVWFWLMNHWTATRVSLVTYAFPVTAVALGVIILGEKLTWELILGGCLIIGGIVLVNRPVRRPPVESFPTV